MRRLRKYLKKLDRDQHRIVDVAEAIGMSADGCKELLLRLQQKNQCVVTWSKSLWSDVVIPV